MDATQARNILRAQEAKDRLLARALNELDLKLRAIVNLHRRSKVDAIRGVRELLRERYTQELAAISSLAGKEQWHNPDFSIASEIIRRLWSTS